MKAYQGALSPISLHITGTPAEGSVRLLLTKNPTRYRNRINMLILKYYNRSVIENKIIKQTHFNNKDDKRAFWGTVLCTLTIKKC